MELSPVNQAYVNNIKKTSTQVLPDLKPAVQNSNLAQLNQDSIELSSKKPKTDVKKFLLIGASVGAVVAAACTLVKYHNTNKIKKLITEQYDKLADDVAKRMEKSDLEFIKPELKFSSLGKSTLGGFCATDNTIKINTKNLSLKNFYKTAKEKGESTYTESMFTWMDSKAAKKAGLEKGTLPEFLMEETTTLAHELEHARQLQISLQSEGAKEYILSGLKEKFPNHSDETIKKVYSFIFDFNSKGKFSLDTKIRTEGDVIIKTSKDKVLNSEFFHLLGTKDGKNVYTPMFTPKAMIDSSILDYKNGKDDYVKYVTNLCEVYARRAEYDVLNRMKFDGVDEATLEEHKAIKDFAYQTLIRFLAK